ncbi:CbtB-domain containing protein [Litoreibacter sp.]|nr:CbtB-domain containing protein [Litoreibacter sp.]
MKNNAKAIAQSQSKTRIDADVMGIAGAVLLGLTLLFAAGFAQANVLHDTAHDMRHAMSFPCH